jgi:hypothetical protein
MEEDIKTILDKGSGTWKRNLNICVPFIFESIAILLMIIFSIFSFALIFVAPILSKQNINPEQLSPDEAFELMSTIFSDSALLLIAFSILLFLVLTFIQSFFTAGAIGMSKEASLKGDTRIGDMIFYGMKNVSNLFLNRILLSLLYLAGIVFLIPGILSINDIDTFLTSPETAMYSVSLSLIGILVWVLYLLILSIVLLFVEHALVIDDLDPITAIEKGVSFFLDNKLKIFYLWVILLIISMFLNLIGEIFGSIELLAQVWKFASFAISIIVIQPLFTVWWTRFYLNRTGRDLYSFEEYLNY